jgi:hypothetical protein
MEIETRLSERILKEVEEKEISSENFSECEIRSKQLGRDGRREGGEGESFPEGSGKFLFARVWSSQGIKGYI